MGAEGRGLVFFGERGGEGGGGGGSYFEDLEVDAAGGVGWGEGGREGPVWG